MNRVLPGVFCMFVVIGGSDVHGHCPTEQQPYASIGNLDTPTKSLRDLIPLREIPNLADYKTNKHVCLDEMKGSCNPENVFDSVTMMSIEETGTGELSLFLTPAPLMCPNKKSFKLIPGQSFTGYQYLRSDEPCGDIVLFVYLVDEEWVTTDNGHPKYGTHKRKIAKHYIVEAFDRNDQTCRKERPDQGSNIDDWKSKITVWPKKARSRQTDTGQGHEGHN